MKRRQLLTGALGLAATTVLPGCNDYGASKMPKPPAAATGPDGQKLLPWQNWSGYRSCLPEGRAAPETLDQLASFMKAAKGPVRPVGSSHSFSELIPTDGTLLSLRNFSGVLSHDAAALTATVGAGTRLSELGEPLNAIGQALPNMPDIDSQTLGGALATGTHGTGAGMGALHSFVKGFQLVTPRGEVLECSREKNPDIFDAGRVSLGALGAITQYTLQNVAPFRARKRSWNVPLEEFYETWDALAAKHYSLDCYLIPQSGRAAIIAIDPTTDAGVPRAPNRDDDLVDLMRLSRNYLWRGARHALFDTFIEHSPPTDEVEPSWKMFPTPRNIRFNEMEYHLPREALLPVLKKVKNVVDVRHPEIFFVIEVRVVKGDLAWLSPFYQHETSGSIAVHQYYKEYPLDYFADVEPLYQDVGGRPHWGKMNTLDGATLAARYPRWKDFCAVRAQLDPEGKMLNPYLKRIFNA